MSYFAAAVVRSAGQWSAAPVSLDDAADVEDVEVHFMGLPVRATSFAEEGVVGMVEAAGLTVLSRHSAVFTPDHPDAGPEPHLFLYCRRDGTGD